MLKEKFERWQLKKQLLDLATESLEIATQLRGLDENVPEDLDKSIELANRSYRNAGDTCRVLLALEKYDLYKSAVQNQRQIYLSLVHLSMKRDGLVSGLY